MTERSGVGKVPVETVASLPSILSEFERRNSGAVKVSSRVDGVQDASSPEHI
jgi:hypothetical protein